MGFLKSEMLISLSFQNAGLLCYVTWSPKIKEKNCDKFFIMLFKSQIQHQNTRIKEFNFSFLNKKNMSMEWTFYLSKDNGQHKSMLNWWLLHPHIETYVMFGGELPMIFIYFFKIVVMGQSNWVIGFSLHPKW